MKALKIIWLFFMVGILNACTEDDMVSADSNGKDENAAIEIAVSLDDLLPVNMNSRTGSIDGLLSQIKDLNIRVTKQNGQYTTIYCTPNGFMIDSDQMSSTQSKTYYIGGDMKYIHCNDIQAVHVTKIQVIANYGSNLYKNNDWNSIVESGDNNLSQEYCMMYGETDASISNKHDGPGALNCQKITVNLKRTRAMLTVQLTGNGLKDGVSITPKKISLHNIPTQCTLLSDNVATTNNTRKDGEVHDIDWGTVTTGKTVGAHDNSGSQKDFLPLYLFENMQGKNDNTSSNQKVVKYPKGCNSVAEAKNNKTHSYVEIEAEYRYEENGYLKNSGVIVYRFFLGENDYNDFNVKRNTYYRLTLNLKGFGGASEDGKVEEDKLVVNEDDVSWRVDMDITDWGFEKDAYTFDAHASFGYFEIMGSGWQVTTPNNQEQWVKFYLSTPQSGVNWTENANSKFTVGNEGKLYYYIEPYYYIEYSGRNYNYNTYRTSTVTLTKGGETKTVTFTQYVPIKIEVNSNTIVYMERFEEENQHKWGCVGKAITETLSLTGKNQIVEDYGATNFKYVDNSGSNLDNTKRNTLYMYYAALNDNFKSDVHLYCIEKSGKGYMDETKVETLMSSSNEDIYCLPSKEIFTAMKNFDFSKLDKGSYEPIWKNEDYWVSNINRNDNTSTYWNGQEYVNGDRNMQKRVRAMYINYWKQ